MLSPADLALVSRDPALPGLSVLLDDDAVSALVGAPVRRTYLRYKPGTSCVLGATAMLPDGLADIFVTAYNAAGTVKADKVLAEAPLGSVLAFDRTAGVVAARAAADRDLPLLGVLDNERRRRRLLERVLPDRGGLRGHHPGGAVEGEDRPERGFGEHLVGLDGSGGVVRGHEDVGETVRKHRGGA